MRNLNLEEKHERITGKNPFSDSVGLPTSPEKAFAQALLENPEAITQLTLAAIAAESGSSEASIIRFCKRMGYHGYSGLKEAFTAAIAEGEEIHEEGIEETDGIEVILKKVFQSNVQTLQNTMVLANDGYQAALDAIISAKSIHFFGVGDAFAACQFAFMKFCRLGIPCSAYSDVMLQYTIADNLGPGDVALAVSYEGRSRNVVQAMKIAKKRGATTISITKMNKSRFSDTRTSRCSYPSATYGGKGQGDTACCGPVHTGRTVPGIYNKEKQDFSKRLKRTQAQLTVIKLCRRIRHVLFGTVGLRGRYYAAGTAAACDGKSRCDLSPCGYHGWQFCP